MSKMFKYALALGLAGFAVPASAATVLTFDGPNAPLVPYEEAGFVIDDGGVFFAADGALHIDIYLGPYADTRDISRGDGAGFDVHALDIISLYPNVTLGGLTGAPRDDVRFEGFRGDALVATATASSQFGDMAQVFGAAFSDLTSFKITGFDAGNLDMEIPRDVHFLVDNLVVSGIGAADDPILATPLPAAGWLLGAALLGLGVRARKRRR